MCATVIRASSWVNRSNFSSTASTSLSPNSFFANFSMTLWAVGIVYCDGVLTESSLFDLLRCQGKHWEYFKHNFYNNIRHYCRGWNRRIYLKAPDEIPQTFKQVKKSVVTWGEPTSSLAWSYVTDLVEKRARGRTVRRTSILVKTAFASERGIWRGNVKIFDGTWWYYIWSLPFP